MKFKNIKILTVLFLTIILFLQNPLTAMADVDREAETEYRKTLPIQSNEIVNWPAGPAVGAQSAILMEANTGTILYSKNIHEQLYPASITKMLTCLLAVENCSLDEIVTFSNEAVFGIERNSSNAGIDVGEQIQMEECLYIILLYSANEVAAGVAEHVAGSIDGFVDMMNEKAAELGCQNTHFNNANGLPDENHYTSAYDMALIAKEFYKNETLCKVSSTSFYSVVATETQPDSWDMANHHLLCKNLKYEYEGFLGGKTGYTNVARQTLVSCAERNGMKLICVILKDESPNQFTDTITLFDYGFNNFSRYNVAENDTTYTVGSTDFFNTESDIFGSSKQIISLNPNDYIILPVTADFADTTSELTYDETAEGDIATIHYRYNGVDVGTAGVELASDTGQAYDFDGPVIQKEKEKEDKNEPNVIFVNVLKVIGTILLIATALIAAFFIRAYLKSYHFSGRRRRRSNRSDIIVRKKKNGRYIGSARRKWGRRKKKKDELHF